MVRLVQDGYLLDKPSPPSQPKLFFDQRVIPAAIDAAGAVEAVLERLAVRTRQRPVMVLGMAMGAGFLVSRLTGRHASGSARRLF
ncbi:hypothetical protein [Rhodovastum atsumiense]|uniref:hypothetical protein n=1 Tax=Rhodovastum atsumiense TaxID=504468 RepID=UPI002025280D|nr:hypothetical protein [Rhodovastum atsumiense]